LFVAHTKYIYLFSDQRLQASKMEEYVDDFEGEEGFYTSGAELPNFELHETEFDNEHPELQEDIAEPTLVTHYQVPEVVKQFVSYFYRHIKDRNVYEIYSTYENTFNKITEKYFKNSPWPPAEAIAPLVHNGKFLPTNVEQAT
jgi:translation initiation factor 3 subunit L